MDEMDFLTMIHQMGKLPEFLEFTEMPPSSPFAFPSSIQNQDPTFPSYSNLPSTLSFNNAAHSIAPPCFLPYSAARRWRTHFSATGTAALTKESSMAGMREMVYRIAAMQPIHMIDPESVKAPKRRNVKISKDPQSIAARHRRERISQKIRILQRIVPGGTKMDTASMLDEAIHYVNFLKNQLHSLAAAAASATALRRPE